MKSSSAVRGKDYFKGESKIGLILETESQTETQPSASVDREE